MKFVKKMFIAFVLLFFVGVETMMVYAQEIEGIFGDAPIYEKGNEFSETDEPLVQAGYAETKGVAFRSGNLDIRPLTKVEIANLYQETTSSSLAITYETVPSLSAPYASGKLSAANIAEGLNYVNMYRKIAGLPTVVEDPEWSADAQYGAVLLAALGKGLSHYPEKPADMDDAFYKRGYSATSSSNLHAGGFSVGGSISGYMVDPGDSNRVSIGHRRCVLDPYATRMGFGGANNPNSLYRNYYALKVFGSAGSVSAPFLDFDWDFISWPASGNFPVEMLREEQAWTITLNNNKYSYGKREKVTVKVTSPDGFVEEFSGADYHANPRTTDKYFDVEKSGYGEPNCIILGFGPNYKKFNVVGRYSVEVNGLEAESDGREVSLKYNIDVFNTSEYGGGTPVTDEQYNAINDFVERMYTKALGRASEDAGKLDWSMRLADHDETGSQVAQGFVFSDEYLNKKTSEEEYLNMLYQVFLGRDPDAAGKEDWKNQLQNGVSREFVFRGFALSQEFNEICKSYGIDQGDIVLTQGRDLNSGATMFVYRLYKEIMEREPDLDGLNDWAGKIARGENSAEYVATEGFFHSEEFQNKNCENEDYVKVLYRTFLGREYDEAGLADWLGRLENGVSRDEVLKGFSNSDEFKEIMAKYGL